ncbi:MAG TPA: NAD(P)-binding domain-containing protein [Thermoleophilaceae bacterium]
MRNVCVIGAGSSGIAACQVLASRGIPFDCFEKGSGVGGNWRYENDNGMSSAYHSLHINTSRHLMEYASYPMPESYPDYPSHWEIARYFDDFVDHFGLRERITFNTAVTKIERSDDDGWHVTLENGETRSYSAVLVANGHHWNPRWPWFPGEFHGDVMHAHHYKTPEGFEGRDVIVLGFGNSAVDIACELGRVASNTYLATRRGAHVLPKYLRGKPTDEAAPALAHFIPMNIAGRLMERQLRRLQGAMTDYGLPEPDHHIGEAHPTMSSELLPAIGHGRVTPKPNISRLEGDDVRFADGTVVHADRIVYCTGYKITFPFLEKQVLNPDENQVHLYRHVVHPEQPGLYFLGLIQPLGAIMPIAERQAEWIADVVTGEGALPSREEMLHEIERHRERMAKRYVRSPRHTIQVDFHPYMRELARERKRSRRRARRPQRALAPELAPARA